MQIPVYLFTGFLEAGKTKFIEETMEDARFNNGEKTLILLCFRLASPDLFLFTWDIYTFSTYILLKILYPFHSIYSKKGNIFHKTHKNSLLLPPLFQISLM